MSLLKKLTTDVKKLISSIWKRFYSTSSSKKLRIRILNFNDKKEVKKGESKLLPKGKSESNLNKYSSSQISIILEGEKICSGCKLNIVEGQKIARCKKDTHHMIHYECLNLVKFECPICGGKMHKMNNLIILYN